MTPTARRIVERIKRLNIPEESKQALVLFWTRSKLLVERILDFVDRHREFAESILLGAVIALLLYQIPWLGGFFALITLVTAAAIGVLKELRSDMDDILAAV